MRGSLSEVRRRVERLAAKLVGTTGCIACRDDAGHVTCTGSFDGAATSMWEAFAPGSTAYVVHESGGGLGTLAFATVG